MLDAASGRICVKFYERLFLSFEESLFGRFAASDTLANVMFEKKNYSLQENDKMFI